MRFDFKPRGNCRSVHKFKNDIVKQFMPTHSLLEYLWVIQCKFVCSFQEIQATYEKKSDIL